MNQEIKDLLKQKFPHFENELLEDISSISQLKEFSSGEQLMRTGQFFRSTILVIDGLIKLYREGDDGSEFFVYHIDGGNACALSMICASQHKTSELMAQVVEDARIVLVPIEKMDELMLNHKSWYYFVLETYRNRFNEILSVVDAIAFTSLDERLEFYLKKISNQLKTNRLQITHQEIANDVNSSREVISRLLKKMEQRGLIKLNRNQIELIALN